MLSHAWQGWKSAKPVALMSILALAVGIGSATAIFTVVSSVMLRPLPYAQGDRMVALFGATLTDPKHFSSSTFPDLLEFQRKTRSFEMLGWFRMNTYNLTSPGTPQHIDGVMMTPELGSKPSISASN